MKVSPRLLRRIHLLLGCFFAPLLGYYLISGLWQSFGMDDRRKAEVEGGMAMLYVEGSNPHKHLTFPGASPKMSRSNSYKWFVAAMVTGLVISVLLGVYIAFTSFRPSWAVVLALGAGIAVPVLMLWTAVRPAP